MSRTKDLIIVFVVEAVELSRIIVEVAQMATSMRDIAIQNIAMRELLTQIQGQQGL